MNIFKKKNIKTFSILFFFIVLLIVYFIYANKIQKGKDEVKSSQPISVNLLTSVNPSLKWSFKPVKNQVLIKPGEVTTVDYLVENLESKNSTGIATFAYFPSQFESYITKLNCFCYDAKTLKGNEIDRYSVVLLIDPEVTKDSKTKNIKEVTIQFIFFNYSQYQKDKS